MADTVEESLRSVISQIDDRFEIVVVDDGSTDGSRDILNRLEGENACLRVVFGNNDNLAEARNESFEEARGKYVLESIDADDRYAKGILDFVELYHQIEARQPHQFYLKGKSINMAPRELLLEYPYRSLGYGEDRDLWRRLFADDKIIWIDHEPFYETIREEYTRWESIRNLFAIRTVDFQSGVSFSSYLRWTLQSDHLYQAVWRTAIGVGAFLLAHRRGRYSLPIEFQEMGALAEHIEQHAMTITEAEAAYDMTVESEVL